VNVNSSLSIAFGKPMRKAIAVGTVLAALVAACWLGYAGHTKVSDSAQTTQATALAPTPDFATFPKLPYAATAPDFATVSRLMNDAIAANKQPGAVVVIGHGGKVAFHQAYGTRMLGAKKGWMVRLHLQSR
jgi:CubicO group peptidase (beta-lactamase class C family)